MAAGFISKPGSEYGHCLNNCKHKDCAELRRMVASVCPECQKEIGYEIRFYIVKDDQCVHANCVEK